MKDKHDPYTRELPLPVPDVPAPPAQAPSGAPKPRVVSQRRKASTSS